jgi:hypothetical protein
VRADVRLSARREVRDRVADELPRPVPGDVAAARDLDQLDAAPCELHARGAQVLRLRAPAQRDHGRMLEQQQPIRAAAPALLERA